MIRRGGDIPLVGLLTILSTWFEERHMELLAEAGFDDLRVAHNAVVVNLPAQGRRLTELAHAAGISKQAMSELVDDLVAKGYAKRVPDPADGRAKLIVGSDRANAAHDVTLKAFADIEDELAAAVGAKAYRQMKATLTTLVTSVVSGQ